MGRRTMSRKFGMLSTVAFFSVLGAAACGAVEQEVREQVEQEIREERTQIAEAIEGQ